MLVETKTGSGINRELAVTTAQSCLHRWLTRVDWAEARKALVSYRRLWEAIRLVLVSRHRWTGTKTLHRDGNQELGLGAWQAVKGELPEQLVDWIADNFAEDHCSVSQTKAVLAQTCVLTTKANCNSSVPYLRPS
jgi:hypothetical protein